MSAPAIASPVDPSGLNGERVMHNERALPFVESVWSYPTVIGLEGIRRGWVAAFPTGSMVAVKEQSVRSGRRYVVVTYYARQAEAKPHIDEPEL